MLEVFLQYRESDSIGHQEVESDQDSVVDIIYLYFSILDVYLDITAYLQGIVFREL